MGFRVLPGCFRRFTHTACARCIRSPIYLGFAFSFFLLTLSLIFPPTAKASVSLLDGTETPTAAEVLDAINRHRANHGLAALSAHPVLMQVAQAQADGIASGLPGHWRPYGMSLGQWLLSLGYPLAGDLSLDGIRSENWAYAASIAELIQAWSMDETHTNTMMSPERSDMGVGIVILKDQIVFVLITALQTRDGRMQSTAYPMLTQAVEINNGTAVAGISQFVKPVKLGTAWPDGDVFHMIEYGQSLWAIAIAYGIKVDQIRAWNNLGQDTIIYEGQVLLVQRGATQPPSATPATQATFSPLAPSADRYTPPVISATPSASPVPADTTGKTPYQSSSFFVRTGIILVLVSVGGLMALLLVQKRK